MWTDPGLKSGISVRELISIQRRRKKSAGREWSNILPKPSQARERPPFVTSLSLLGNVKFAFGEFSQYVQPRFCGWLLLVRQPHFTGYFVFVFSS